MTLPAEAPVQPIEIDLVLAPPPDPDLVPEGFLVGADGDVRLHFLDWGGPRADEAHPGGLEPGPGVLLVPGLLTPAWSWAPVARRLARVRRTCVMDLRGHGLSDAPPDGYDLDTLAADAALVAEASGVGGADGRVVLAGHGFGACVAAAAAAAIGERCAGLVLVDGGLERLAVTADVDADELLRALEEPPEVLRTMDAWLADRRAFDEASWDADQERAARDAVVETAAGHVVRAVRPFVLTALVPTLLAFDPAEVLPRVPAPITVLVAMEAGVPAPRLAELRRAGVARAAAGRGPVRVAGLMAAHNLPRYRPADVVAAILAVTS
jgi:pimeloyl-ACP methyl ester carboxylesterase